MTTDNWLTILLIISNFIAVLVAPLLALFVKSRINQPKPTPEPNQPKNLSQIIRGWLMRVLASPWLIWGLPLSSVLLNIYFLRKYLLDPAPITRPAVFIISLCVTLIWFSFLNIILNASLKDVWQTIRDQWEVSLTQSQTDRKIIDSVDALAIGLQATTEAVVSAQRLQTEIDKSKQGVRGKLRAAIKRLTGD
jgi:hypothetical protein